MRVVIAARKRGLTVTGTMGLLARAANRELLDLADTFHRPSKLIFVSVRTSCLMHIMDALLAEASREV